MFSYQAGSTESEAAMNKNNAAIKKTEASNQWNYYQAKSSRQNLAELATHIPGVDAAHYSAEALRYKSEKEVVQKKAQELEVEASAWVEENLVWRCGSQCGAGDAGLVTYLGKMMRASLRQKICDVCNKKINDKGPDVGLSFYAFFANRNDNPELLMEAAEWWIMRHKLDHFEKAVKIKKMVEEMA